MKKRALFLDRDGVINIDHGYIGSVERFDFNKGIFDFLRAVQNRGWLLVVVTNQSGVARGKYTEGDHHKVTAHMRACLAKEGITLDGADVCFEHKDGFPPYNRDSYYRKPNPGMVLAAAQQLNIDLSRSAMIGDKDSDMQAAVNAGVPLRLLLSSTPSNVEGAQTVRSFDEALAALVG